MNETKICETCKNKESEPNMPPCDKCRKASHWESKNGGCDFCNDQKEKMPEAGEFNYCFEIEDSKLWAWDAYFDGGAAIKIKFCPMCGKKLVKE